MVTRFIIVLASFCRRRFCRRRFPDNVVVVVKRFAGGERVERVFPLPKPKDESLDWTVPTFSLVTG